MAPCSHSRHSWSGISAASRETGCSSSISGAVTRRHHGLLVAALPTPLGRMVLLSNLWERVRLPDRTVVVLSAEERMGARELDGARKLVEFRLEDGLPVWLYDLGGRTLE